MPNIDAGLMARKHCGDFLWQHNLRDAATLAAHDLEWSQLGKIKHDAKREMSGLIDKLADGLDNRRGAEIEAASDELSLMVQIIDREMDERNEAGNRSPRPNPMLAKIPVCEGRTAAAFDDGQVTMPEPEAFALRSDQSMKVWAKPKRREDYSSLTVENYLRATVLGAKTDLEARALTEGSDSAGGFIVPTELETQVQDRLRAKSVAV